MKGGILYINGQPVKRERVQDYVDENSISVLQYQETLPNGVVHPILEREGDSGQLDNTPEVVVEPGHYFAMGDNRDDSADSRTTEVGQVPAENLVGRAVILFFSTNGSAELWEVWKWPFAIRYDRFFKLVK
jgi:signal peptidase I